MPALSERVPNKGLTGQEVKEIILRDVRRILERDGLFTQNISFSRVSFETRVSIHLDNPMYPEHVSITLSRPPSKQEVAANPALASLEAPPLEGTTESEFVFSEELHREIASPNMARVEHELPIQIEKKNLDTGQIETKEVHFTGDTPEPASVGNITTEKSTVQDQKTQWDKKRRKS